MGVVEFNQSGNTGSEDSEASEAIENANIGGGYNDVEGPGDYQDDLDNVDSNELGMEPVEVHEDSYDTEEQNAGQNNGEFQMPDYVSDDANTGTEDSETTESSEATEGSEDSEGSESSEHSEGIENSEGSESSEHSEGIENASI